LLDADGDDEASELEQFVLEHEMVTRAAIADAGELTPQGTCRQRARPREAELEELLQMADATRVELEAVLSDTEASLTAAQLELQRIQLGEDADETLSISSEGSRPSLDDFQMDDGDSLHDAAGGEAQAVRPPVGDTFFSKMARGPGTASGQQ
jgi:hypothetical protein